jgi:hypothetical protein
MWKNKSLRNTGRLPKLCGADVELGNFILGGEEPGSTCAEASRALLRQIEGLPPSSSSKGYSFGLAVPDQSGRMEIQSSGYYTCSGVQGGGACGQFNPQDWGRKFLPSNGGCAYIDLDHLEICLPEIISAWDWVSAYHAMMRIARDALKKANRLRAPDRRIQVLVNNSDGRNNSYGSHLNFLITRRAWENLFLRKMHHLLYLATFQVSSIIICGQGKVGSENGNPAVAYQLSQRADFLETLLGPQTTFNRPIVNSRDESLCGRSRNDTSECARLHVIFFDSTLAHVASLLKVGLMQIILSMIEAECVNPNLLLDDPVDALSCFSQDPTLKARALTVTGQHLSALDLQSLFLEEALRFVNLGGCEGIVPRADEILLLWQDTLQKLKNREFSELSRRIDWILKLQIIARAMAEQPELSWTSPQIRYLDQLYSSLDDGEGLYWAYDKNGFVERIANEEQIEKFLNNPPDDTRAYARAMLLRSADPDEVDSIDWDSITLNIHGRSYWPNRRIVNLAHPLGHTRALSEHFFQNAESLEEILDAFEASDRGGRDHRILRTESEGRHSVSTH